MFKLLCVEGEFLVNGASIGSRRPPSRPYDIGRPDLYIAFKVSPKSPGNEIPYIPASSWVGVMRNLLEKFYNLPANAPRIRKARKIIAPIHECETENEKLKCPVCKLLARRCVVAWFDDAEPPGEKYKIRVQGERVDILNEEGQIATSMYLKDEVVVPRDRDRIEIPGEVIGLSNVEKASANDLEKEKWRIEPIPRRVQQVSGRFLFKAKFDMSKLTVNDIRVFFTGLALMEDYFIGRRGSRGYGRVKILNLNFKIRNKEFYEGKKGEIIVKLPDEIKLTPKGILDNWNKVKEILNKYLEEH